MNPEVKAAWVAALRIEITRDGVSSHTTLVTCNDEHRMSSDEIADLIEDQL